MDLTSLISQLVDAGIGDIATIVIVVLYIRYSASESRREISNEIDDKIGAFKNEAQQSFQDLRQEIRAVRTFAEQSHQETRKEFSEVRTDSAQAHNETRQEINAVRTYAEQSHKETMLHLIDVRERLANIEGRLGQQTPRLSGVSPPLEAPAEEPSAQS